MPIEMTDLDADPVPFVPPPDFKNPITLTIYPGKGMPLSISRENPATIDTGRIVCHDEPIDRIVVESDVSELIKECSGLRTACKNAVKVIVQDRLGQSSDDIMLPAWMWVAIRDALAEPKTVTPPDPGAHAG